MADETQNTQTNAALAQAWNSMTPYDQIRTGSAFEPGQYDFTIQALTPQADRNGLYTIRMEAKCDAPGEIATLPGKASIFIRTLYIGTKKDHMAEQPDTRLASPGLGFLKNIAEVNHLPANAQSDAQMCQQLLGKRFGIALIETKYEQDGKARTGLDFGRTVTPVGTIPAKLHRVAAAPNGQAGAVATAAPVKGATFQ